MTYRQAPIREPIEPPWRARVALGRRLAYSLMGAGSIGAAVLLVLVDPTLAVGTLLIANGMGLSILFGGGGTRDAVHPDAAGPSGPDEPLRRAGLQPVGWTEWRAERDGFPVRVLYSALSAQVCIEVALGSAPSFAFELESPVSVESSGEVVGPFRVLSDQPTLARAIASGALRRAPSPPARLSLQLVDRVLRTRLDRTTTASGYESVIAALETTLAVATVMVELGQGLAPFRRS